MEEKKKWYDRKWAVRLLLIIFYPVGLYGFIRGKKPVATMVITTLLYGGFWTLVILAPSDAPEMSENVVAESNTPVESTVPTKEEKAEPEQEKTMASTSWYYPDLKDLSAWTKLAGKWSGKTAMRVDYSQSGIALENAFVGISVSANFKKNAKTETDKIADIEITLDYDTVVYSYGKMLSENTNKSKKQIESDKEEFWRLFVAEFLPPQEKVKDEYGNSMENKIKNHSVVFYYSMSRPFLEYFCQDIVGGDFYVNSRNDHMLMTFGSFGNITANGPLKVELKKFKLL
jgi:hypothetical protein